MFEFLFKYRPLVFERGDFSFALPVWAYLIALLTIGVLVPLWLQRRAPRDRTDRIVLGGLRIAALAILAFSLFRPVLLISTVVPQRNYVAVLLDDSGSMRVVDEGGMSRGERAIELFGRTEDEAVADGAPTGAGNADDPAVAPGDSARAEPVMSQEGAGRIRRALADRFRLRFYRFSSDADRIDPPTAMRFGGSRTRLVDALDRVTQEMTGLPLSGVIVVSDGADNGETPLTEQATAFQAAGVPVYTVGLGEERIAPDVEVRRVEVPQKLLAGTTVVADVILSHAGLTGQRVRLDVEDEGTIVGSREVELAVDGELPVQVQFTAGESGPRRLRFRARPLEGETVLDNNVRETLAVVGDDRRKILYFEGEPRPELKFLRRAVEEDENVQLVVLLRTAKEKFLRLAIDDPEELSSGFPATREELFRYDGLVLGSVEASFFTHDQLQMIADFVAERGGGLLVLGGRRSLDRGGYAGTPLADALPFQVGPAGQASDEAIEVHAALTPAGRQHPALRITDDQDGSAERWTGLPPITRVNEVGRLKPGAVSLLSAEPVGSGETQPLLAYQRYGRGLSIAFVAQDIWLWQMHADIPLEDMTHETLWRQLFRWLIHDTPGRVDIETPEEAVPPGEPVAFRANVEDARFIRVNGATVNATVTGPDAVPVELPMEWTLREDGEYEARFSPPEPGLYQINVDASSADATADGISGGVTERATGEGYLRVGEPALEPFGAGRRTALLQRLAEDTGGRFYTSDDVDALPEEIRYTESGDTVQEARPLWDMPILFLLLAVTLGAEWLYRRARGLA